MKKLGFPLLLPAVACLVVFLSGCAGGNSGNNSSTPTPTTPVPSVTSVSPSTITAGASATTLTVTGTNFTASSIVQVNAVAVPTTYNSATQLSAVIPAAQLVVGGSFSVSVSNGTTASAASPLQVTNPVPAISSLIPAAFLTGSANTTVAVVGTGFTPASTVRVQTNARSTSYVSPTQLNITLTAADLSAPGSLSIDASNPTPGGGSSSAVSAAVNNPAPTIASVSPTVVLSNATTPNTINVVGTNLLSGITTATINGSARAITVTSQTQASVQLTADDQKSVGRLTLQLTNPAPGGGTASAAITVSAPTATPVIQAITPSTIYINSPATTVTVQGLNFASGCSILWNGTPQTSTYGYVSGGSYVYYYLSATIPASNFTSLGTAAVTVTCPTASSASAASTVTISNPPAPSVTSVLPASGAIGTPQTLTVSGSAFTAASVVLFNGKALDTTYKSANSLTAVLPANLVGTLDIFDITVSTPAPGGGVSPAVAYGTYVPLATNSMVMNPVDGLIYASVPSSAGAPYGNSIVSVDPANGAIGTPIPVGSEPNKLALSSDGKSLWVGLDGASAVRKVDLVAKSAGLQFNLGNNSGIYANPSTATALAVIPGSPDSVVVSWTNSNYNGTLGIFDSGVRRGSAVSVSCCSSYLTALSVNGSLSEVYGIASGTYVVYTYNSSGLTAKVSFSSANSSTDTLQVVGGRSYGDFGRVLDAESGALLGTFYSSGSTVATGPAAIDSALGKAFILSTGSSSQLQLQAFNLSDYTVASTTAKTLNFVSGSSLSRLLRWGTNGLAFRSSTGIYGFRSSLVKDMSSTKLDVSTTLAASGSKTTGTNTTFTATFSNAGPSSATGVVARMSLPANGVLATTTPSQGTCSASSALVSCDLGTIASGANATVALAVLQTTSGDSTVTAAYNASETDTDNTNDSATATVAITGDNYNPVPALTSVSPVSIQSGASDTALTINGANFTSASTVQWNGTALSTTYVSSTQLKATVPASNLASMGYGAVTVSNAAPGGGVSAATPVTVFQVITVGLNHIAYEPFSRKLYATVGSGSSTVTGNSIAAITPETGTIGTPVSIGSQPTQFAISDSGNILYAIIGGSNSVARFNLKTQQAEFTMPFTSYISSSSSGTSLPRTIAVQPGSENTIAVDLSSWTGLALFDVNPTSKTVAIRGASTGPYTGSSLQFLDANNLFSFDTDTTGASLNHFTVLSSGFQYYNYSQYKQSTLLSFGAFKIRGGKAYANAGGVANPATDPATQLGIFKTSTYYSYSNLTEPDPSLNKSYFLASTSNNSSSVDGVITYDATTYMPVATTPLNMSAVEGNTSYSGVDLIRWGQDGLAALTSGGHLYLFRGPAVVPQQLQSGSAATLSANTTTLTHGSGNTYITLTGSNFQPGVAIFWNGDYRTTTLVDSTHVKVAIPYTDLGSAGTASVTAVNPGASASAGLTVTIN